MFMAVPVEIHDNEVTGTHIGLLLTTFGHRYPHQAPDSK